MKYQESQNEYYLTITKAQRQFLNDNKELLNKIANNKKIPIETQFELIELVSQVKLQGDTENGISKN